MPLRAAANAARTLHASCSCLNPCGGFGKSDVVLQIRPGNGDVGQFVAAFIIAVARMAFHPAPIDLVAGGGGDQPDPEILIFHPLFRGGFPAAFLPAIDPFLGHGIDQVFRIRMQLHFAGPSEQLKRGDGGAEFHPVVSGALEAGGQLLAMVAGDKNGAVAARAWIALAAAVGVNDDSVQDGGVFRGMKISQARMRRKKFR